MNKSIKILSIIFLMSDSVSSYSSTLLYGIESIKNLTKLRAGTYRVQVGLYKNRANAQRQAKQLRTQYQYPVVISQSKNKQYSIVTVGPITVGKKNALRHASARKAAIKKQDKRDKFANSQPANGYPVILGFAGGAMWNNAGRNQQFNLLPDVNKAYLAIHGSDPVVMGEFFAGMGHDFSSNVQAQLGVAFAMNSSIGLNGDVLEDSDPDFNNYTYHYKVRSTRLSVKGKLLRQLSNGFSPYVTASAGLAFNNAHDFKESPKISQEVSPPFFQDHTKTSFTYALGAGLQKVLSDNWSAGIGYEFADLGRFSLGRAPGQTVGSGLNDSHLSTHSAVISFNFTS